MKTFKEYLAEIELAKKKITTVHNPPPGSLRVRVMVPLS